MLKTRICFLILPVLLAAGVVSGAPHKLRVSDPALAKSLTARGARLIADYGGFQLLETDDALATNAAPGRAELEDEFDVIELAAKPLNTRMAEIRALRKTAGAFSGKRLHLVQFAGPIKPEWCAALEKQGARIVSYLSQNAYLVYGDAAALGRMQTWAGTNDFVQWDGDYADDYKIHPDARLTDASGRPQPAATDTFSIQLVDDADANAATLALIDGMKLRPVNKQYRLLGYLNVIVSLPPERLGEIAARPEVVSLQPYFTPQKLDERQDQIIAGNLTGNLPSGPGYLAWLAGKGFTQSQFTNSGFVVDVSDSGIDNGTNKPGHFGLYPLGNTSQVSRVVYNRLTGTPNSGSTLQGCEGHGTLNTHIIGGYDNHTGLLTHTDASGYSYGLGVCPFVKVGSSVVFDPDYWTYPNYATLQTGAYNSGARICNNSWGAPVNGRYDSDAQAYDALVRDVGASGGNRPMVIVFAAGNAGSSTKTINSPGTAKNVITVGASENVRSLSTANGGNSSAGNDGCTGDPDTVANSANDMTSFSSRGPCRDGRVKPDLVAPGTHITGGVAQNSPPPLPSGTGSAISCYDAKGVCALSGSGAPGNADNFFPLGQQFYTVSSGTSHSTPAVSGACALLRQYFINNSLTPPSPAMTKAYLMNSARYLTGTYANDTLWSSTQGMGELNLGMAFDGVSRILRDQMAVDTFTNSGQIRTFTGTVSDPTKPFRVTLAWTDAPGSTTGNAFNNNLDLAVIAGGNTYKGNVFSGAFSTTGGTADSKNNVESVFLAAGVSNTFTVTVTAANINSDAITNGGTRPEQDFALVIYNGTSGTVTRPVISSVRLTNNVLTLTWTAVSNTSYRVQYKTNLLDASWIDLSPDVLATNSLASATNRISAKQRFYRVRVLP